VEGGGAVGAGEPADGDEGAGARVHLAAETATLPWPPALNSLPALPPTRPLRAAIRAGTHGACGRSPNRGRGGEITPGGRADPETAGEERRSGGRAARPDWLGFAAGLASSVRWLVGWLAGSATLRLSGWPQVLLLRCRWRINQ
jgi:hypothetical protein